MEILYLLLPMSLIFVAMIGGILWWAVFSGQYDDTDSAAVSILQDDDSTEAYVNEKFQTVDLHQGVKRVN